MVAGALQPFRFRTAPSDSKRKRKRAQRQARASALLVASGEAVRREKELLKARYEVQITRLREERERETSHLLGDRATSNSSDKNSDGGGGAARVSRWRTSAPSTKSASSNCASSRTRTTCSASRRNAAAAKHATLDAAHAKMWTRIGARHEAALRESTHVNKRLQAENKNVRVECLGSLEGGAVCMRRMRSYLTHARGS